MCVEITLDGNMLLTIGQLRTAIGDVPIVDGYNTPIPDNSCLCPVDVEALVGSGRFACVANDDPFCITLKTNPPL